ncbi:CopD family protein [Haliea sp. E1-2-M8]|uniref:CopD family protein n=1 Tax=Haliea sp. E1-2-M8 TaxID=3064706 RepID=UPI00271DC115|nr:CopD family protein [Haliea sp. E1-2-M8]MDO8863425.1 CopD family protein [Haliea sp. E1-2-M8]
MWILVLHISALLLWCAALLYLPVLMVGVASGRVELQRTHSKVGALERLVFTHLATPAALVAIISGTVVFVFNRTIDGWLMAKLTLVVGLVVCHTLLGLLVLRATTNRGDPWGEHPDGGRPVTMRCVLLAAVQALLIMAILWTVLAKPDVVPVP